MGRVAMDELHQQTVSLLSFQTVPREQYDAQVAFNLLRALGDEAKIKLADTEARIEAQYTGLVGPGAGACSAVDTRSGVSWICGFSLRRAE